MLSTLFFFSGNSEKKNDLIQITLLLPVKQIGYRILNYKINEKIEHWTTGVDDLINEQVNNYRSEKIVTTSVPKYLK